MSTRFHEWCAGPAGALGFVLSAVMSASVPAQEVTGWYGLLGPAGTPREIVSRLNIEAGKVMRLPASAERLAGDGVVTFAEPPETFTALVRDERIKWARVVRQSGIRAE